tara:strand:+ start:281 stop:2101 length:1821 start_codon:yes stop_codon:yes gene_type:complete
MKAKSTMWWTKPKADVHTDIFEIVSKIHMSTEERRERNLRSLRLYGNMDLVGLAPYSFSTSALPSLPENRVKINIVSSMVDTVSAKISKMKPRVTFLTSGGDFSSQANAKKLSKFALGTFYKNDTYKLHQAAFRDAAVFDIGALKHYIAGEKIVSERVLATELYVDDIDAMYGNPRNMYQVKYIHKDVLGQMYPDKIASINMASNSFGNLAVGREGMEDYVVVIESWHLNGKEGRHVISMDKDSLLDEDYTRDYFPFTFFRWASRLTGFWGQSLAERLTGNQIEINKMLRIIQKSFHLGSTFKILVEHGSRVAKEHLNNDIGSIIQYSGTKPDWFVPQVIHPEYFRHLDFLIDKSFEEAGVSQMSAASQKPGGLESGVAIREWNDLESERFALVSQCYEESFLETTKHYIDLVKEMSDNGVDYEVKAQSKRFIEAIKWSEIDINEDQYITQMFPVSMLPHLPAGRLAMVQELISANMIPQEFGLKLLDFPDLEGYASLSTASIDDLAANLEAILVRGEYESPEPFQDLNTGIKMFQSAYLRSRSEKVPEAKLEMLRIWIESAQALLTAASAPAGPDAAMAPPTAETPPEAGSAPTEALPPTPPPIA